ncbi:MAG: aminotransferase class I/II-fold pyridoxal phosphate-dependent enzyme [Bacteroidetes bacterium]|nr:aminotransferase class I/II-fold pyridoxal phosphate-dependent enzyme [Bacteroidota bacterium]
MKKFKPADALQDLQYFGEFGGVNPSISDSSTYTFLSAKTMFDTFEGNAEGCYLYSRHSSPSNLYLGQALAAMEGSEAAHVTASGMAAISGVIMQLCQAGDHIVAARTIYGGTYAFLKNFLPKWGIQTTFVDITKPDKVVQAIQGNTKMLYCESMSNPLLEIADLEKLSSLAHAHQAHLVVDNTFTPLLLSPIKLGADIVIHSLTKFINGSSDTVAGVICGSQQLIDDLRNVNNGACMLLGATLDSIRAASIMKNLRTLHVRMEHHSKNAQFLAKKFEAMGLRVVYPGLESHPQHQTFQRQSTEKYGFGGMLTLDVGDLEKANALMEMMQHEKLGYLAVSLGFYKTLFSAPGTSTSSEISEAEQLELGITSGLIRFSIGLDCNIERTFEKMKACMQAVGVI